MAKRRVSIRQKAGKRTARNKKGKAYKTSTEQRARSLASDRRSQGKPAPKVGASDREVINWYKREKEGTRLLKATLGKKENTKQALLKETPTLSKGKGMSNKAIKKAKKQAAKDMAKLKRRPEDGKTVYLHEGNRGIWESIKAPTTTRGKVNTQWKKFEAERTLKVREYRRNASEAHNAELRMKWETRAGLAQAEANPFPKYQANKVVGMKESVGGMFYDYGSLKAGNSNTGDYLRAKDAGVISSTNQGGNLSLFDESQGWSFGSSASRLGYKK